MKIIKPQLLGLLSRPFEYRQTVFLGLSILAFIPLDGRRALLPEVDLWKFVAEVLGADAALDEAVPKNGGEFLITGNAWPRQDADPTKCRVDAELGELSKAVYIFGNRYFNGDQVTEPEPFESIPLSWKHAFGGQGFADNPLGVGLAPVIDESGKKCHRLPNIEYPDDRLVLRSQKTRPAGFGPIDRLWPQRRKKAGTHDQAWLKQHFPGFAADIDWSYFNIASTDQQQPEAFRGDEPYRLMGMHPSKAMLQGQLPGIAGRCLIRRKDNQQLTELACRLSTVWFFPEHERAILIFHASTQVNEPDAADIGEVMIAADNLQSERTIEHFQSVHQRRMDRDTGIYHSLSDHDLLPGNLDDLPSAQTLGEMTEGAPGSIRRKRLSERLESERRGFDERMDGFDKSKRPEDPLMAEAVNNLGNDAISSLRLDELPTFMERAQTTMNKVRKKLEQDQQNAQAQLAQAFGDAPPRPQGPPTFRASDQEQAVRSDLARMKAQGMDVSQFEQNLLSDQMRESWQFAETGMISMYRRAAHMQDPVAGWPRDPNTIQKLFNRLKAGDKLNAIDFSGADLSGLDLSGANLAGIFLEAADLRNTNLAQARLDNAVLAHADLTGARLDKASLGQANLGKAILDGASLCQVSLTGAVLTGAVMNETQLDGSDLSGADIREAQLIKASLKDVIAERLLFYETGIQQVDFSGARLDHAIFLEMDLDECNFTGAHMKKALLLDCRGRMARLSGADLHNLRMVKQCNFAGADFSGARVTEANLRGANLADCNFNNANLDSSDLGEAQAERIRMIRATARGIRLVKTNLRQADLTDVNLMQASLERADIREATLAGANLFELDLARAHVNRKTSFERALTRRMSIFPVKFPRDKSG